MPTPRCVLNLRKETFNEFVVGELAPFGYLLAPNNATSTKRKLAKAIRKTRRELFIDNGNFKLIGQVRKQLKKPARDLHKKIVEMETDLSRSVRRSDMTDELREAFLSLSRQIRSVAEKLGGTGEDMLEEQLALDPTRLVGVEDITMAAWLSLDVERSYVGLRLRDYRRLNESVALRASKRLASLPGKLSDAYYPVASAVSYNTARDAGRVFAEMGIERISMGFGAYMADNNFVDHMLFGRRRLDFPGRLPTRYSRTAAVARGFWDGYEEKDGGAPKAFHFLGLGAPIMIPIVTLCAAKTPDLTFDATSPIKDAVRGGTLYVTKPAYLKIRTRKVAWRLASDPARVWDCPCPFCKAFVELHPFQYELGHQWFSDEGARKVLAKDMRPGSKLFDAYPLLSEPSGGSMRKEVNFARIGHNHWALERITKSLKRASRDGRLEKRVENIIGAYTARTTAPFAAAVQIGLSLAKREFPAA